MNNYFDLGSMGGVVGKRPPITKFMFGKRATSVTSQLLEDGIVEPNSLTTLGSGTSHDYTYHILKHFDQPFWYVHIDAHCDVGIGGRLSFAEFVNNIADLDMCEGVSFLGDGAKQMEAYPHKFGAKMHLFPQLPDATVPNGPYYVSVDLDVLCRDEFVAGYPSQGSAKVTELEVVLGRLASGECIGCDFVSLPEMKEAGADRIEMYRGNTSQTIDMMKLFSEKR